MPKGPATATTGGGAAGPGGPSSSSAAGSGGGGGGSGSMAGDGSIPRVPLLFVNPAAESYDSPIDRRSDFYRQQAWQHRVHGKAPTPRGKRQPLLTLPNVLTFLRLVLVPVLVLLWHTKLQHGPIACALLFVGASLTDWLDGYLARKLEIATTFGAFLDPVADKVMVATTLILLTISPPAPLTQSQVASPVIIIICREITMSALREWAAAAGGGAHKAVKVNALGKWKTALQMTSMSILLFCRDDVFANPIIAGMTPREADVVHFAWVLLWGSAMLAVWSLSAYFANVWTHFVYPVASKAS